MSSPEISVLIPVYGVEKYIGKCLTSLFENSMADICEFILVNDCTKDNSIAIAEKLISEKKVNAKIVNHTTNSGIAKTRNTCLENANGKYIVFVDSDDWVEKDFLEKLYTLAERENSDLAICGWYENRNGNESTFFQNVSETHRENFEKFLKSLLVANLWNKLIKRTIITESEITFEDGINNWEDEVFCTKVFSAANKISYINLPLYHYRVRMDSYIRCLITEKTKDDFLGAVKNMEDFLSDEKFKDYRHLINYKKIHAKQKILMDGTRSMQKRYISLWPECAPYIKEDKTLTSRSRLIMSTAAKVPAISLLLLFCLSALKIILRKQFTWKDYLGK